MIDKFVVAEYRPLIGSEEATLLTYSLESGEWVKKKGNYMLGGHFWRSEGGFEFDGHLYFMDLSCGLIVWDDDPFASKKKEAEFRFIPLPNGCRMPFNTKNLEKRRCIGVGGGHIQFVETFEDGNLSLWRLINKGYKQEGELWSLVHKVSLCDIKCDESYLGSWEPEMWPVPNLFHPFEADTLFFEAGDELFNVNVGTKRVLTCGIFSSLLGFMCLMPFVIPTWPTSLPPSLTAASEKDLGNEYFKEQKFDEAIRCYSRSIIRSQTAVAYANRAAANLKICKYLEAEGDCTEAIKLDEHYMKAYARRAIARKELKKLTEAKEDAEFCLQLEPQQEDILKHYAEIKYLLEKETMNGVENEDGITPQS